jgi:O-antigen/teichoic acid export membrane protein
MTFLTDVQNLLARYQEGDAFKRHVSQRFALVLAVVSVLVLASAGITVGTVLFIGGKNTLLILLMFVAAPFILIGSLLVGLFMFFSWLEERAIADVAGRPPKRPPIPAGPAVILVLAPFICLALLAPNAALGLAVVVALTLAGYVLIDRIGD